MEGQASISQLSRNMRIYDSFFALPFVKIGVYGLISPRFCGMGSGHSALGSYSLQSSLYPISIFPLPDFQRTWRFLALPHGINYMGFEMHSPVYIFVVIWISPLGPWRNGGLRFYLCYLLSPLSALRFTVLVFYSSTFFCWVTSYSQVRPRHQWPYFVSIPTEEDLARDSAPRLDHTGKLAYLDSDSLRFHQTTGVG